MKYLVIEIQTFADGTVSNLTYSFDTENEAVAKYHSILSVAAVSKVPMHACMLFTNNGISLRSESFSHAEDKT